MKIFISWSGDTSRVTAEKLSDWIKSLFQFTDVFVSSQDIEKGESWSGRLAAVLNEFSFGLLVLNAENVHKPWINFEAGALYKGTEKARVIPLLCDVRPGDLIESPLGQFQAIEVNREGLLSLVKTINRNSEPQLPEERLAESFEVWWDRKGSPVVEAAHAKGAGKVRDTKLDLRDVVARVDNLEGNLERQLSWLGSTLLQVLAIYQQMPSLIPPYRQLTLEEAVRLNPGLMSKGPATLYNQFPRDARPEVRSVPNPLEDPSNQG